MPQSEQIGELAKAIAVAQSQMQPVKKECKNPFFNSRYADLASVWEALKPFHAQGIAITQMPFDAGEGMVGITTQLTHTSGQWVNGSLALPVSKDDAQGVGSAITYARRYALGCMTGVVTEEDDDGNAATTAKPAQRYQQHAKTVAKAMNEIREDVKAIVNPSFNPEACPPDGPQLIDDETFQNFVDYIGDDPDRMKIGKKVKAKMSIGEMSYLHPKGRKAFMLSIQDEAKRQGVPFSEWVKE